MYYLTKIYSIACKVKKKNMDYKILAPLFVHKCDRRGHGAVACRLLSYGGFYKFALADFGFIFEDKCKLKRERSGLRDR